ncbi:hypothetical protein ACTA71_006708 [Dictyostelium dimigraforme]
MEEPFKKLNEIIKKSERDLLSFKIKTDKTTQRDGINERTTIKYKVDLNVGNRLHTTSDWCLEVENARIQCVKKMLDNLETQPSADPNEPIEKKPILKMKTILLLSIFLNVCLFITFIPIKIILSILFPSLILIFSFLIFQFLLNQDCRILICKSNRTLARPSISFDEYVLPIKYLEISDYMIDRSNGIIQTNTLNSFLAIASTNITLDLVEIFENSKEDPHYIIKQGCGFRVNRTNDLYNATVKITKRNGKTLTYHKTNICPMEKTFNQQNFSILKVTSKNGTHFVAENCVERLNVGFFESLINNAMKLLTFSIYFILFQISCILVNSQEIINYYFDSNNENQGNGTIINPFQDLCILNNILQPSACYNFNNNNNHNKNLNYCQNNSIINIYMGFGNYNLSCKSITISNFNNITISTYNYNNQNQNQNQNQTNIENLFLNLQDTNLIINGPIILNMTGINFINSNSNFNNATINYLLLSTNQNENNINNSSMIFNHSTFKFTVFTRALNATNSLFKFFGSSFINGGIIFNSNYENSSYNNNNNKNKNKKNKKKNNNNYNNNNNYSSGGDNIICSSICGVSFSDNSIFDISFISLGPFDLNFTNSKWKNSAVDSTEGSSTILISKSEISQTLSMEQLLTDELFYLQKDYQNEKPLSLSIIDTTISFSKLIDPLIIVTAYYGPFLFLENVKINGYRSSNPMIMLFSGSEIKMNSIFIEDCISYSLISTIGGMVSSIEINKIQFNNNIFDSIIDVKGISNVTISELITTCEMNNKFYSMIIITTTNNDNSTKDYYNLKDKEYVPKSNVSLSFMDLSCIGSFQFESTSVEMLLVNMSASFNQFLFTLTKESILVIDRCDFILNPSTGLKSTAFLVGDNSDLYIVDSTFGYCGTGIVVSTNGSSLTLINTSILKINLGVPVFTIGYSTLEFYNCTFEQTYIQSTSLIDSFISNITIDICTIDTLGGVFISSFGSNILINQLVMANCFTQYKLFQSNSDSIIISNSLFNNNHGFGYNLFHLYESINFEVISTHFINNSFSPIINSQNGSLIFKSIKLDENVGSFLGSVNDTLLQINNLIYKDNKIPYDYLFSIEGCNNIIMDSIIIDNNYLTQYLIMVNGVSGYLDISNFNFKNNKIVTINSPFNNESISSLIFFNEINFFNMNEIIIIDNKISSNFFYFQSVNLIIKNNSLIKSNEIIGDQYYFIQSIDSNFTILNSNFIDNQGDSISLINLINCNLTINGICEMSRNDFSKNGNGSIISLNQINYNSITFNYFMISNLNASFNLAKFGGVFQFGGYSNGNDAFINPLSKFINNTFNSNIGSQQGGVIYTEQFSFSNNIKSILKLNNFENNTSICGPNFSSELQKGMFSNDSINVINGVDTLIEFYFVDYFNNTFASLSIPLNISITRQLDNSTEFFLSSVMAGKGTFLYQFLGDVGENYLVESVDPTLNLEQIFYVDGCLPYQYLTLLNETCEYCENNFAFSQSLNKCYPCDSNIMNCFSSTVFAIDGYYIVDNDVSMVEECPLDLCLSKNLCTSNSSFGNLCFSCKDEFGNKVQTKNGIRCCSHFKPILLIPILAFHLSFALVLSLVKYNSFRIPIGQIIIFLQINSVVFFSYSGIYILPLFRMTVDMLDGYCLWEGLNYNFKSFLSFSIIISLFLIGSTDITPLVLIRIYKKRLLIANIKNININNIEEKTTTKTIQKTFYPNFLKEIIKKRFSEVPSSNIYYWKSIWSLFQLFIIPLMFNAISLIVSKNVDGENYLSVDFSIVQNQTISSKICTTISIIIFIIISSIIILIIFLSIFLNFKKNNNYNNRVFKKIMDIKQTHFNYKQNFKWYDQSIIKIIQSTIFCVLSITMFFKMQSYTAIITSIQMVYMSVYYFLPSSSSNPSRDLNNYINLLQLIILIIANSNLLQLQSLFNQGLILTCITFLFSFVLINLSNIQIIFKK